MPSNFIKSTCEKVLSIGFDNWQFLTYCLVWYCKLLEGNYFSPSTSHGSYFSFPCQFSLLFIYLMKLVSDGYGACIQREVCQLILNPGYGIENLYVLLSFAGWKTQILN